LLQAWSTLLPLGVTAGIPVRVLIASRALVLQPSPLTRLLTVLLQLLALLCLLLPRPLLLLLLLPPLPAWQLLMQLLLWAAVWLQEPHRGPATW
jgi:hypothetical protein